MTHHHNHDHDHDHHHHDHDHQSNMTFGEKLDKLLDHWIKHNAEHANTYRQWAERARGNGFAETGALMDEAADTTDQISEIFASANALVKSKE